MHWASVRIRSILCYCRQAVEKSLKAFLTWHDEPFAKTHDQPRLGQRCVDINPSLEALLKGALLGA
jgi:HEPN domain-containing protein